MRHCSLKARGKVILRPSDVIRFLKGAFRRNLGLKALALVLSVTLWGFVAGESKVQVGFVVPLEIRGVPLGLTITNKVERQVEVRLAGPPSILATLQQPDISAVIDLSSSKQGKQVLHLDDRSIKIPPGVKVQRIYPNVIEVSLERLERRRVPVVARIAGGGEVRRRIARSVVVPNFLEVEALPEEFSRIRSLSASIQAPDDGREMVVENVHVELREGHAKIVGNPEVRVTIHFRK